jgi:hypothetical protein
LNLVDHLPLPVQTPAPSGRRFPRSSGRRRAAARSPHRARPGFPSPGSPQVPVHPLRQLRNPRRCCQLGWVLNLR